MDEVQFSRLNLNASKSRRTKDDGPLYCICQKPYDKKRSMIQCDTCDEWYHTSCVGGVRISKYSESVPYTCPKCIDSQQIPPPQGARRRSKSYGHAPRYVGSPQPSSLPMNIPHPLLPSPRFSNQSSPSESLSQTPQRKGDWSPPSDTDDTSQHRAVDFELDEDQVEPGPKTPHSVYSMSHMSKYLEYENRNVPENSPRDSLLSRSSPAIFHKKSSARKNPYSSTSSMGDVIPKSEFSNSLSSSIGSKLSKGERLTPCSLDDSYYEDSPSPMPGDSRRKYFHKERERVRRQNIRTSFENLKRSIPGVSTRDASDKLILVAAVRYIDELKEVEHQKQKDIATLKLEQLQLQLQTQSDGMCATLMLENLAEVARLKGILASDPPLRSLSPEAYDDLELPNNHGDYCATENDFVPCEDLNSSDSRSQIPGLTSLLQVAEAEFTVS